jgi:Fusaric acid resistance protein-like
MNRMAALFRIKPGTRLNPSRGAYTAIAVFLPLLILAALNQGAFGAMVMLGTLLVAFANVDIAYRVRAWLLGVATIGGALLTALGHIISGPWWLITIEIFLAALISGLLAVYGQGAAIVGLLLSIPFVIALGNPNGLATALLAAEGYLLGGVILMLFALAPALLGRQQNTLKKQTQQAKKPKPTLTTFTAQFTFTSPMSRYALLRAVGAASAAAIGWGLGAPYPYWAALAVIICAREDREVSLLITAQYVTANILGALLAYLMIVSVHNSLIIGLIVVAITFITFTVKDLNYAIQVFFLTNLTLLLISLETSGQSFARWRVESILIGAGIVLVVILVSDTFIFGKKERRPILQQ